MKMEKSAQYQKIFFPNRKIISELSFINEYE